MDLLQIFIFMKRFKVLFISGGYPRNGAPSHCPFIGYRLAYLQKYGIHADVLSFKKINFKNRTTFLKVAKYIIISIFPFVTIESYNFIGEKYMIYNINYSFLSRIWLPVIILFLVKAKKYSLFHYHFLWFTENLVLLKKIIKIPAIITVHGSDLHTTAINNKNAFIQFKHTINKSDKIIYVSKSLQSLSEKIGLSTDKDIVIHNGFDANIFALTRKNAKEPIFGFVGRIHTVKRADKLPEIFYYIKEKIPNAKLIIVGGIDQIEVEKQMKADFKKYKLDKCVNFIGEVLPERVSTYYAKMDVLLFPSRNEGFGAVVVESRACGVPVVGCSNGGIPEAVGDGGKLVTDGDDFERRFAEAAVNLLNNLPSRENISNNVADFAWDKIILQEIDVYKKLIYCKKHKE